MDISRPTSPGQDHITLNCTDVAELGIVTTGTAKEAWDSIQNEWGKSTDMRWSHAQEALDQTVYDEGSDIQEHIKLLRTRKATVDNLSTSAMSNETWKGIIICSIPPTTKWLPVVPSLYNITSPADIFSILIAHGMILDRGKKDKPTSGSSNTALAVNVTDGCTNPNCKAKKRATHTTANCYWPGGGKEGQFPPNFGQRARVNIASSTQNTRDHFVLSARIPKTPGTSGCIFKDDRDEKILALVSKGFQNFGNGKTPTFMDSGASDTMFILKASFNDYKATPPCSSDSAKAVGGEFEIVGEGNVTKSYLVNGKEKRITYTRAIQTLTLNANLVSVSTFGRAGLTIIFEGGCGVVQKKDGTVVLTARCENGMYVVDKIDHKLPGTGTPLALTSISQPTSLAQWHHRLAHCSPLTISEMTRNGLVDGLKVSGSDLQGKCEDCILGRQTHRPFNGETEKGLCPLELVSFDLWGPS